MVSFPSSDPNSDSSSGTYRSGFIALIGRPNVGKSTLVNQLVGEKVAITSPVAQTTRNRLRAILTMERAQMVLVDTPGIHKPHHLLGERLVRSARSAIGEVDLVLLLLENIAPRLQRGREVWRAARWFNRGAKGPLGEMNDNVYAV